MRALWIVMFVAGTALAETRDYTVREGDTCYSIVERELGDRDQLDAFHALNPQLGKLPHHLKAGQIVKLPVVGPAAADANLSSSRGAVRVRKPEVESWAPAERGMDLYRAWRVNSQTRSSAEVTFAQDQSRLFMRENTVVVIFGPVKQRAKLVPTEAILETGALESRLDAATKRTVTVKTPSSEAEVGAGHSLVTVDPAGTSIVANHGGKPVAVRGVDKQRKPRGKVVSVATGMGSKVVVDKLPEPPRPLPPAPAWSAGPRRFIDPAGRGAEVDLAWDPVAVAARYRIEIVAANGNELTAVEVPATTHAFVAYRLAPGGYVAHVSTIDADNFESLRSVDAPFIVLAVTAFAPGSQTPLPAPPPPAADADLTAAPAPLALAAGSRLVAPDGVRCATSGAAATELVLTGVGPTAIHCTSDAGELPPLAVELAIVDVHRTSATAAISRTEPAQITLAVASDAPLGGELAIRASDALAIVEHHASGTGIEVTVRATGRGDRGTLTVAAGDVVLGTVEVQIAPEPIVAIAPPPRLPRRHHLDLELGALAGIHGFSGANQLGTERISNAPSQADAALLGVRAGILYNDHFGVEAELGLVPTTPRHESYRVTDLTYRAHLIAQLPLGRWVPFALVGFGAFSVVSTNDAAVANDPTRDVHTDTDPLGYGGLGVKYSAPSWGVRADVRLLLPPSSSSSGVTADGEAMLSAYVRLGGYRW